MSIFGNQAAAGSAGAGAPLTMESLLGLSMNDAKIMEGMQVWAKGKYAFRLTGIASATYKISKPEEHPFLGQEALRIELTFTCTNVNANSLVSKDNKKLSPQEAQAYVGQEYKESIMFGNDGLPNSKTGVVENPGLNKMATMFSKIVGAEAYEQMVAAAGGNVGAVFQAMENREFACEMSHNVNPNDPNKRVQSQIDLFGEFIPIAG